MPTVKQLQAELKKRGLDTKGKKAVLEQRLKEAEEAGGALEVAAESGSAAAEQPAAEPTKAEGKQPQPEEKPKPAPQPVPAAEKTEAAPAAAAAAPPPPADGGGDVGDGEGAARLIALSWALRREPSDFSAAAAAALASAEPERRPALQRAIIGALPHPLPARPLTCRSHAEGGRGAAQTRSWRMPASATSPPPSSSTTSSATPPTPRPPAPADGPGGLSVQEHSMMLDVLPVNLTLELLLASPLLALDTPPRLRSLLPLLSRFPAHISPDDEAAAGLLLRVLLLLLDAHAAGIGGAEPAAAARSLLEGRAALPLLRLAPVAAASLWERWLQQARELSKAPSSPLATLMRVRRPNP